MTLRSIISRLLAAVAITVGLVACDVHQLPEGEEIVNLTLTLNFDTVMPLYKEVQYNTKSGDIKVRHTIKYFASTGVTGSWRGEPEITQVIESDQIRQETVKVVLEPIMYNILVWSEFIDAQGNSLYYDSADFRSVELIHPDNGCDDAKDTFRGGLELNLSLVKETNAYVNASIDMERAVAKYSLVSTDRDEFVDMYITRLKERAISSGQGPIDINPEDVDLSVFKVQFIYTGYLPDTFNNFVNRPVDSRTGVSFESFLRETPEKELELGFDYMLAKEEEESAVSLQIRVLDDLGDIISISNHMDIPMMRGMLTVMKGKFLTSGAASGISINPGFDGEFNLILP